jgi:hypothetical protein
MQFTLYEIVLTLTLMSSTIHNNRHVKAEEKQANTQAGSLLSGLHRTTVPTNAAGLLGLH